MQNASVIMIDLLVSLDGALFRLTEGDGGQVRVVEWTVNRDRAKAHTWPYPTLPQDSAD